MIIHIEKRDIFTMPSNFVHAHCISSDFIMGAGIAKEYTKRGIRKHLLKNYPKYWNGHGYNLAVKTKNHIVCNLITKQYVSDKPTLKSLEESLQSLKDYLVNNDYRLLTMPKIGCGLDKLNWADVLAVIKSIFNDTNIYIVICEWSRNDLTEDTVEDDIKLYRLDVSEIVQHEHEYNYTEFFLTDLDRAYYIDDLLRNTMTSTGQYLSGITSLTFTTDVTWYKQVTDEMTVDQFEDLFNVTTYNMIKWRKNKNG